MTGANRWSRVTWLAGMLASCSDDTCDVIEVQPSVSVEPYEVLQVQFSMGELPVEISHPTLKITAYGKSGGLVFWVRQDNGKDSPTCSSELRGSDETCSRITRVASHGYDGFWIKSDAHGSYDLELGLFDLQSRASIQEDPICSRSVRVDVPVW